VKPRRYGEVSSGEFRPWLEVWKNKMFSDRSAACTQPQSSNRITEVAIFRLIKNRSPRFGRLLVPLARISWREVGGRGCAPSGSSNRNPNLDCRSSSKYPRQSRTLKSGGLGEYLFSRTARSLMRFEMSLRCGFSGLKSFHSIKTFVGASSSLDGLYAARRRADEGDSFRYS